MNLKKNTLVYAGRCFGPDLMACSAQNGSASDGSAIASGSSDTVSKSSEAANSETKDTVTITSLNAKKETVELKAPLRSTAHCHFGYGFFGHFGCPGYGDRVVGLRIQAWNIFSPI